MRIRGKHRSSLYKTVVSRRWIRMRRCAGIIQRSKNSGRSLFLDEITQDLVVEILDGCPLDLLPNVLFLLCLECQFNEDLLQLLVDIVYAKLLERIILKKMSTYTSAAIGNGILRKSRSQKYPLMYSISIMNITIRKCRRTRMPTTCAVAVLGFMDTF